MLTKKITNNILSISDTSGKVWCEIACDESNCVLTLFPQNIPEEFRGKENTNTIKWQISCASPTEAQYCQEALASLILNGYNEPLNWYFPALDIEDLISIFSDEMNFCELTIDADKLSVFSEIISDLKITHKVFVYFRAEGSPNPYVLVTSALTPNCLAEEIEIWSQYSIDNEIPLGSVVVDMWYC